MTSKDALEMIVVDLVPKAKENNKEEIQQLENDLEVLDILKKHIKLTPYKTVSGFKDDGMSDDEFNKVKEWLKNE